MGIEGKVREVELDLNIPSAIDYQATNFYILAMSTSTPDKNRLNEARPEEMNKQDERKK